MLRRPVELAAILGQVWAQSALLFLLRLCKTKDGASSRNTEFFTIEGNKIKGNDVLQEHVRYGDLRLYERLKMLPLLRQVRECGRDARLKLRYGFSVITPANLAFARRG